jgi:hypothetical protein
MAAFPMTNSGKSWPRRCRRGKKNEREHNEGTSGFLGQARTGSGMDSVGGNREKPKPAATEGQQEERRMKRGQKAALIFIILAFLFGAGVLVYPEREREHRASRLEVTAAKVLIWAGLRNDWTDDVMARAQIDKAMRFLFDGLDPKK